MPSTKGLICLLFGLVAVAAMGGYFVARMMTVPTVVEVAAAQPSETVVKQTVTVDEDSLSRLNRALSENERLKKEMEALEAYLVQEKQSFEEFEQVESALPAESSEATPPQELRRLSMEDIKAQDPERYERMMTNLQNHQNRMREMRQYRMEFLAGVDTSLLTKEEQQVHNAYLQALSARAAAEEEMWEKQLAGESLEMEDFERMRETSFALRDLQAAEKTALLNAVGTMYNISEENLEGFVNTINEVSSALDGGMRMPGFRGGPGGPRGPAPQP